MKQRMTMMKRLVCALGATVLLSSVLTACVPLVLGGAVAGGSLLAIDRRTSGAQLEDEGIELRAASRIRGTFGDRVHVNLTSYNRQVLLTGEVPSAQLKQQVEQVVTGVENVVSVVNELATVTGQSGFSQRSNDTFLTGRVKAMLLDARDLQSNAFKVVTERGTVYLMGRVTQREADRATQVVRSTPGVQKVVRVFEVISEQELGRIGIAPAAARPASAPMSAPAVPIAPLNAPLKPADN